MTSSLSHITGPILRDNPVTVQILGICSALAVTTSMTTAATMCVALTGVLVAASGVISLIRRHIPGQIRLILQITIIAALVIVADLLLQAYAFAISERLSIFVSLIVTNCIVLGRAEAFAMSHPPFPSMLDALGNGLGYSAVLLIVAFARELFGQGTLFGATVFQTVTDGGWYEPWSFMLLAPSAFVLLGLLVWAIRAWQTAQAEPDPTPVRAEGETP
ncbi:NADH:ubiquinone reductase (Na(+)-transporting) subunit D [Histidinibacterium aquaticum]|uniref:NADH:ubiquinone reductase (Na(+)-transporting) subunit D n=1 Tax=Histidinibacterium aquaticum TaxID=2613962 RepID=A0A5J5GNW3_9RHOB|nr:NADH:ubiquinone reductase (Na(+)-transporting) subunit D [Histidinibacterium aquaticum]KAA9009413.1 NADH:ubiquinone reductase (Na(+)-transporting) subunit D [Histidinibacterium aquaticum]